MKALVFKGPNQIVIEDLEIPEPSPIEALIKVTKTTICGTDIHIWRGEFVPEKKDCILGHEPVGVIVKLGSAITGYSVGQRVVVGAITPCAQCEFCLNGNTSQCGGKVGGGWKLGNKVNGSHAEYMIVPFAQANLCVLPDDITDEEAVLCPDVMSTGFGGVENAKVKIGDSAAVFAPGPIGLSATACLRLQGATTIFQVGSNAKRLEVAKKLGADHIINYHEVRDTGAEIKKLTGGRGVDVAVECKGLQETFQNSWGCVKPGGHVSILGVYDCAVTIPNLAFGSGIGDHTMVTTLCPGGKERMRRMVQVITTKRANLKPLLTHHFKFSEILEAYRIFGNQLDGVLKVVISFD
jgi:threonine dehydrogenase-like Zn-dependent dehydrogenase